MIHRHSTAVVIGAGAIGSAVAKALADNGEHVFVISRHAPDRRHSWNLTPTQSERIETLEGDVEAPSQLHALAIDISREFRVGALIYVVGNCPPGGFAKRTSEPLRRMGSAALQREFAQLPLGFLNVMQAFQAELDGHRSPVIVIGSAITRFIQAPDLLPTGFYPFAYVAAQAALEAMVVGLRREARGPIHLIKPSAVNTPFHDGNRNPTVPLEDVTSHVLDLMKVPDSRTIELLPLLL